MRGTAVRKDYAHDGVLFVGDGASVTSEGTLRGAPWFFTSDQAENIASMHALGTRLEGETVRTLVASHTGTLDTIRSARPARGEACIGVNGHAPSPRGHGATARWLPDSSWSGSSAMCYTVFMDRSRAYPVVDLARAIVDTETVSESLGRGSHDRESVAQALGYSSGVGLGARRVAALVHYGLMNRLSEGNYELSDLAKEILHPVDEDPENLEAKRRAALNPKLFREVYDRLVANGRIPTQLANILVRDFGVTRQAAEEVARIFRETLLAAQLADSDGRLSDGRLSVREKLDADSQPDEPAVQPRPSKMYEVPIPVVPPPMPQATSDSVYQTAEIKLSAGMASLRLPRSLSSLDLKKLRKFLEVLELDIEDN